MQGKQWTYRSFCVHNSVAISSCQLALCSLTSCPVALQDLAIRCRPARRGQLRQQSQPALPRPQQQQPALRRRCRLPPPCLCCLCGRASGASSGRRATAAVCTVPAQLPAALVKADKRIARRWQGERGLWSGPLRRHHLAASVGIQAAVQCARVSYLPVSLSYLVAGPTRTASK